MRKFLVYYKLKTCIISYSIVLLLCSCSLLPSTSSTPDKYLPNDIQQTGEQENFVQISPEAGVEQSISSESGFYEIINMFPNSANILYTDYESNQRMFLCARPECTHDNDSCQSYIDTSKGNYPALLFANGKLLLMTLASSNASYNPQIEILNADGTERRKLVEFKASEHIGVGRYLYSNNKIYFIIEETFSDATFSRFLVSVDLESGVCEQLAKLDPLTWLYDGVGPTIYFKKIIEETSISDSANAKHFDGNITHQIIEFRLDTQQSVIIKEWSPDTILSSNMLGGSFYEYRPEKNIFTKTGFIDQSQSNIEVPNTISFSDLYFTRLVDNYVIITGVVGNTNSGEPIVKNYVLDFTNHSITEITLFNDWQRPITVCGEYKDMLLVQYNIEEVTSIIEMNGNVEEYATVNTKLGRISLDDYLKSIPNYTATINIF